MHSPSFIIFGALVAQTVCSGVTSNGGIVRRYAAPLALMAAPVFGVPVISSVEVREPHHQGAKTKKGKAKAKAGNARDVAAIDINERDLDIRHHQGAKTKKGKAKAKAGNARDVAASDINERDLDIRHHQGAKAKKGKAKKGKAKNAAAKNA